MMWDAVGVLIFHPNGVIHHSPARIAGTYGWPIKPAPRRGATSKSPIKAKLDLNKLTNIRFESGVSII